MNPTQMAYKTKIFKIDPYVNDLQNTNRKVYHSKLIISVYTVISNKIILLKTGKYKTNWYTTERIKSLQLMFDLLINIIWISADIKSLGCSYRPQLCIIISITYHCNGPFDCIFASQGLRSAERIVTLGQRRCFDW